MAFLPALALPALFAGSPTEAQQVDGPNTKIPSTLRYGSGYLDVPAATVLPHLAVTSTFSTFRLRVPLPAEGGGGTAAGRRSEWKQDGALAIGLFDRFETGVTLQSLGGGGGNMIGGFGQLALLRPGERGLGFALGGRFVSAPSFPDQSAGIQPQPGRLGFPDPSFHRTPAGAGAGLSTRFTPYGVGTVLIPGGDLPFIPSYDLSLTLGYGGGMFREGGDLEPYAGSSSEGWIGGAAAHLDLGENLLLNLMGDYNGFDLNFGAQLDFGGLRAGAFVLGWNYGENVSVYRSRKFGVVASLAVCPGSGGSGSFLERVRCWPGLIRERASADTVRLPAPPPDTVVVVREVAPPPPPGVSETLCLSTGQSVEIRITAEGDTLVGPDFASLRSLGSALVFAGGYAESREWYRDGATIDFDGAEFRVEGPTERVECQRIMRIGEFGGVPLFASIDDYPPFVVIHVPVRPGSWQTYVRRSR